jgi:hypothetical protein
LSNWILLFCSGDLVGFGHHLEAVPIKADNRNQKRLENQAVFVGLEHPFVRPFD